jgi:hypothetical protein
MVVICDQYMFSVGNVDTDFQYKLEQKYQWKQYAERATMDGSKQPDVMVQRK